MIGWILAAAFVCKAFSEVKKEERNPDSELFLENKQRHVIEAQQRQIDCLRHENSLLKMTINNHSKLLHDYDRISKFAKSQGYRGPVTFFYMLANEHDKRFASLARFLAYVQRVRGDIAHNGTVYSVDQRFFDKLKYCHEVCERYQRLPNGRRLRLS